MKKIFFALLFCIWFLPISSFALVEPSSLLYVTDEAHVLTEETSQYIIQYSDFIARETEVRYYVVTVPNLEGYDIDTYADYTYGSFGMGTNGLLIFFAKEERMIKVIAGNQISYFLTDEDIENTINSYFMPYFRNDDWDSGIRNGYSAFYKMICNYYNIDSSPMEVFDGKDFITKYQYPILMFLVLLGTGISYLFCSNLKKGFKKTRDFNHFFIFGVCILSNVLVLVFGYMLKPYMLFLILGSEVVTYMGFFSKGSSMSFEEAIRLAQRKERLEKQQRMLKKKRKQ